MEELTIGSTFAGRYEVRDLLGSGGMGKVYKVIDKKVGEVVALKLLKQEIASDGRMIERFRNELKLARKITHRNVCRMHDLNEEKGIHYITMEFVPGETLKTAIKRKRQHTKQEMAAVAKQICDGLIEAHRLGIVHRDLKPQNIMIDEQGIVRIMDFGIARSLQMEGMTETGFVAGTPEYMSPEQVEGGKIDQRSDIYSFGIILYEMMTGSVPFKGDTSLSIALKHKTQLPLDPRKMNGHISEDLSKVILKCLAKEKSRRYQNAGDLLSDIVRLERGISVEGSVSEEKETLTSIQSVRPTKRKAMLISGAVILCVAVVATVLFFFYPRNEDGDSSIGVRRVAVLYFDNNTGDKNLEHWRKTLSDLLIADLAQSKYLNVLDDKKLYDILKQLGQLEARTYSQEALQQIADRGKIQHLIVGNYAKAGDTFRINAVLKDTQTGGEKRYKRLEGVGEKSIFPMVDDLTKMIKMSFNLSDREMADDIDREIGTIKTSSPEAYRYYSEGIKYQLKGYYPESIQSMKKAVAIDPEFAMAYRSMAMSYANLGSESENKDFLKKALDHAERVSDRERYLIMGDFYKLSEATFDEAIDAYLKLLKVYPDDLIGNNNLGNLYSSLEQWDNAIERFEVLRQNREESINPYTNLADAYKKKGMFDKAKEVLEGYLHDFQDNAIIHGYLALNYLCQSDYDAAIAEADRAHSLDPDYNHYYWIKGDIYQCKGDLENAGKEYQKLLTLKERAAHIDGRDRLAAIFLMKGQFERSEEQIRRGIAEAEELREMDSAASFRLDLAYIQLRRKDYAGALAECERILRDAIVSESLSLQRSALYFKGLTYCEMNALDDAAQTADELKSVIKRGMNQRQMRYYHHLNGMIMMFRNDPSEAIKSFSMSLDLVPSQYVPMNEHCLFIDSLASAYLATGDLKSAEDTYRKITALRSARHCFGDVFTRSFYMLAKIYQQQKMREKAAENYDRFLSLWKEADPGIPEVVDARKQLSQI